MRGEQRAVPQADPESLDQQIERFNLIAALFVALVAAGLTLAAGNHVLRDPDTLWQIKVGRDIWESHSLPDHDVYSFTFFGQKWIADQWLAQLLISASYIAGGWNGVVGIVAISVGLTAFLFCREIGTVTNPRIAAIVALIAIGLTAPIFSARPHVLVLPIAVAWTAELFGAADKGKSPPFLLLALLITWVNIHGTFTIAILIAGFAFCHVLETYGLRDRALLWRWASFLICCLAAMFVHPYGIEPILYAVRMARGNDWIPMIVEWLPFNARDKPIHEAGLLAFFAILLWTRPKLSLSKIAMLLFTVHMFFVHQRFVFALTLVAPMAVIRDVVAQESRLSRRSWIEHPRDVIERFAVGHFRVTLAGLAVAAAIVPVMLFRSALEPPSDVFADKALRFAQENLLPARVLNGYDLGGTLIFHGIPTFVDGRSGLLFQGKFAADAAASIAPGGASVFIGQLEAYQIGWTLLSNVDPRNLILATLPQWQRAYVDIDVTIYKRISGMAANARGKIDEARTDVR